MDGKNVSRLTASIRERPFQLSDLDAHQKKEHLPHKTEAHSGLVDQSRSIYKSTEWVVEEEGDLQVREIFISTGRAYRVSGAFADNGEISNTWPGKCAIPFLEQILFQEGSIRYVPSKVKETHRKHSSSSFPQAFFTDYHKVCLPYASQHRHKARSISESCFIKAPDYQLQSLVCKRL